MNNKGQIGKILTAFPVTIAVFLIMVGFIAIVGISNLQGNSKVGNAKSDVYVKGAYSGALEYPFSENVFVENRGMRIGDIIVSLENAETDDEKKELNGMLGKGLKEFMDRELGNGKRCFYIANGKNVQSVFVLKEQGNPSEISYHSGFISGKTFKPIIDSLEKKGVGSVEVNYFYGECVTELTQGGGE